MPTKKRMTIDRCEHFAELLVANMNVCGYVTTAMMEHVPSLPQLFRAARLSGCVVDRDVDGRERSVVNVEDTNAMAEKIFGAYIKRRDEEQARRNDNHPVPSPITEQRELADELSLSGLERLDHRLEDLHQKIDAVMEAFEINLK